jgi:hypothetical protein
MSFVDPRQGELPLSNLDPSGAPPARDVNTETPE